MQLIETIAIIDGKIQNVAAHQQRFEQGKAFLQQHLPVPMPVAQLQQIIQIPVAYQQGLVRCRVSYDAVQQQVEFFPYQAKSIQSFQLVQDDDIDYRYKYANRERLNQLFAQRGTCDEIIVVKQGLITDCSIGNLLFLQQGQWFTPHQPLLQGTQRATLLAQQRIVERQITVQDVVNYEQVMMINALNGFDE
ncbi:MAG: aminotransferase class IV family protein, partial [Acinetobacter sp.]|nr:aminotransferase class IV family protein [Acinetobacter sp.]